MDKKEKGTAKFGADETSLLYHMYVFGEKLYIELENKMTKEQWRTGPRALHQFASSTSIPDTTIHDYAQLFSACFADTSKRLDRMLSHSSLKGSRTLTLVVRGKFLKHETRYTFSFTMIPVPREHIDILEAHLQDLRQELQTLAISVECLRASWAVAMVIASVLTLKYFGYLNF